MPFGVVSGVSQGMGVLDGGGDRRRGRGNFVDECGASHYSQWTLCCVIVRNCVQIDVVLRCEYSIPTAKWLDLSPFGIARSAGESILFHQCWRRGSSQITLGFLVVLLHAITFYCNAAWTGAPSKLMLHGARSLKLQNLQVCNWCRSCFYSVFYRVFNQSIKHIF